MQVRELVALRTSVCPRRNRANSPKCTVARAVIGARYDDNLGLSPPVVVRGTPGTPLGGSAGQERAFWPRGVGPWKTVGTSGDVLTGWKGESVKASPGKRPGPPTPQLPGGPMGPTRTARPRHAGRCPSGVERAVDAGSGACAPPSENPSAGGVGQGRHPRYPQPHRHRR